MKIIIRNIIALRVDVKDLHNTLIKFRDNDFDEWNFETIYV